MALITPVAGRYTAAYTPNGGASGDIGIMQEGYRLRYRRLAQMINKTDAYGQTPLTALHQGAECFLAGVALEYGNTKLHTALFPMSATAFTPTGANSLKLGTIGITDDSRNGTLVLASTAGTPAASSPATLTATGNVNLEPNSDV